MSEETPVQRLKMGEVRERLAAKGSLEVELSDGTVLVIPPPELWSEKCRDIIKKQRTGDADDGDLAKEIFGAAGWKAFLADGGNTAQFSYLLIQRFQMTAGESSASSTS
jgi:hypothetical protein